MRVTNVEKSKSRNTEMAKIIVTNQVMPDGGSYEKSWCI